MFDTQTINEISKTAARLGVETATLLAVAEAESAGKAFAIVAGRREPLIRFEGHYFDRQLAEKDRERARKAGLSHPSAGVIRNPASQAARWDLLRRAAVIDHQAAHESVSWGVGQVMGSHWAWLGYATVDELVAEARRSAGGQVEIMARYIDKASLATALRKHDWAAFARGYNGPGYQRHGYDRKIAAAFARHSGAAVSQFEPIATSILGRGASGPEVVDLQTLLVAAGHPVARDGIFGLETEQAVRRFQKEQLLDADGIAGPLTYEALGKRPASAAWFNKIALWWRRIWN